MRIEVLVPGIRKERGKLPAPTALGALKLAVPLAAGPPTCSELIGPVLPEPVNAAEVGLPVATEHPVNPETIKSVATSPRQCAVSGRHPFSDRGASLGPCRLRRVEFPIALFNAASPLVPGNGGSDMVRASALACSGNFRLRLAGCQGKDLIAEAGRATLAARRSCGPSARAASAGRRGGGGRCFGRDRVSRLRAFAVARQHTLGSLQFFELASELLALRIDAGERLADPLLLLGDLIQCGHFVPSRRSLG
jgi:hypothetical protein